MHSSAEVLLDKYEGNLFKLREAAKEKPEAERKKLQEIKGLAKVRPGFVWGCGRFTACFMDSWG